MVISIPVALTAFSGKGIIVSSIVYALLIKAEGRDIVGRD